MKVIKLVLLISLAILASDFSYAEESFTLIKIPKVCGDNLKDRVSQCSVNVECKEVSEMFSVTLTYSCPETQKKFKAIIKGHRQSPPSGLLSHAGLYLTQPRGPLRFVSHKSMQESNVTSPGKDSFFFFNHDKNLLELTDAQCGENTLSIKGKCYKHKERSALILR